MLRYLITLEIQVYYTEKGHKHCIMSETLSSLTKYGKLTLKEETSLAVVKNKIKAWTTNEPMSVPTL